MNFFPRFNSENFVALKCLPTKLVLNQDLLNAVISASFLIYTTTVGPVQSLARETIPVLLIYLLAISVQISQKNRRTKIKHRRRYTQKQKSSDLNTSKDDLELLGDDEESFTGSQADLAGAAENLFSSPPRLQLLRFESLSLKTPHNIPPTPGTAFQNKIESRLEKSLGSLLNIQLKQEMGVFQASMLEAMKSVRGEMLPLQKASELSVVKTSDSTQAKPLPGTSSQPDPPTRTSNPTPSEQPDVQPMDLELYGTPLPPKSSHQPQSEHASKHLDVESEHSERFSNSDYYHVCPKHKRHSNKRKHKSKPSHISQSSAEEDESSVHVKKPPGQHRSSVL